MPRRSKGNGKGESRDARPVVRCAIYTRKSTDENLDSDFNSLDAQREAADLYIRSQAHEGWVALPERYDDAACSGATVERPALKRLLADVEAGKIDVIVIYKIDRFSRSLLDFTKLIEALEAHGTSLVAVTQQFNTTTSMGRLTLNILLSFAQFEREVIAERIRDKMAAAKRRGKYTGGVPPLGYDVDRARKRLVVNPNEAALVHWIFRRYTQVAGGTTLVEELNRQGKRTKTWTTAKGKERPGVPWTKSAIYKLLSNPIYVGRVRHKDETYEGEHDAIIERVLWDEVQEKLAENGRTNGSRARAKTPAMLKGLIRCGHCGTAMGITFTSNHGRRYRYYLCTRAARSGYKTCPVRTVPAGDIERAVLIHLRRVFQAAEIREPALRLIQEREESERVRLATERRELDEQIGVLRANASRLLQAGLAQQGPKGLVTDELAQLHADAEGMEQRLGVVNAELDQLLRAPTTDERLARELEAFDRLWDELFPAEQARLTRLVVEKVTIMSDGIDLALRTEGLDGVLAELIGARTGQ